jgi:hypothetical protein
MTPLILYRISAALLLLFAMGHTIGFLSFKPPTAEGIAVKEAMTNVHFQVQGSDFSYGGFYEGFGLSATANLLFSAFLAWHLSKHPDRTIGWAFCGLQIVGIFLSWRYFAAVPAVLSAALAACLGWAASRSQTVTRS